MTVLKLRNLNSVILCFGAILNYIILHFLFAVRHLLLSVHTHPLQINQKFITSLLPGIEESVFTGAILQKSLIPYRLHEFTELEVQLMKGFKRL